MLTNLGFNLVLLLLSDTVFIIGAANIGYLIFNFLNLNAGWIHRMDRPRQDRPWRAPSWILAAGALLSFVNSRSWASAPTSTAPARSRPG